MWLPWESARLRSWAEELRGGGEALGERIERSLDAPKGSSLGSRAKLSLEATRASERGVGAAAAHLLGELEEFEARWQHGVLVSLRPRLYGRRLELEEGVVERLQRLLCEPVARFLQELALPEEWSVDPGAGAGRIIATLVGAGIQLRVLRIGEAYGVRAHHEQRSVGQARGVEALAELLGTGEGSGLGAGSDSSSVGLPPLLRDLLRPSRGLQTVFWQHIAMPLWSVGPADNPTRCAQLEAWLGKEEPSSTAVALVGRGLWDRSSTVRRRASEGLRELGIAAAALVPELLCLRRRPTGWARTIYDVLDELTADPAFVEAFAARLRPDEEGHLRWLGQTRSVGAKAAIPALSQALAIAPVTEEYGTRPPQWRRERWLDLRVHLRQL